MNILVIGYYNHNNLGDEQYKISIPYVLNYISKNKSPNIPIDCDFIDCDKLVHYDVSPYHVILLGGGDVLNTYFLNKLNTKIGELEKKPRVLAFSVGIPYNSIFLESDNIQKLEIFDHIFLRTLQDIPIFSNYFHENRISYLPDSSCFLKDALQSSRISSANYKEIYLKIHSISKNKKIINVNLCRHIYNKQTIYRENYLSIIRELSVFLKELIKLGYFIVLIPFNTKPNLNNSNDDSNHENDIIIQRDILAYMNPYQIKNILSIEEEFTIPEILSFYSLFYISIPMRFHGTLFSIHSAVPMIPIYTTKKIKNILLDIDWEYAYPLEKNEKDLPISFNANKMIMIFTECVKYYKQCHLYLKNKYNLFKDIYNKTGELIYKKIFIDNNFMEDFFEKSVFEESEKTQDSLPEIVLEKTTQIDTVSNTHLYNTDDHIQYIFEKLQSFAKENGFQDFREITDPTLKNIAVSTVSYFLTNQIDSNYNDGLNSKMFSLEYDFKKEWKWVIQHFQSSITKNGGDVIPDNPEGLFNISYIDQNDQSGAHRSGWKYVFDNIKYMNNSQSPLKLDLYVDRTFHWKLDIYKNIGIIPYKSNWIGFVHHTFDTTFSDYNNKVLLQCPEFIESLRTCKGLIVLSNYLKNQFITEFEKIGIIAPPIYAIRHPMDINVPQFSIEKFIHNPDKKIVNIGGWLRNIYSFYQLEISGKYNIKMNIENNDNNQNNKEQVPPNVSRCLYFLKRTFPKIKWGNIEKKKSVIVSVNKKYELRKVALKGKYMDNYYPNSEFLDKLQEFISSNIDSPYKNELPLLCSQNGTMKNNWYKHFFQYIEKIFAGVEVIHSIDNEKYDDLLTQNIVFLNLVDGSAINTLIECIVRNTPVVINRHPVTLEILGENYPLFYNNLNEIEFLLREPDIINYAHYYLKQINNQEYSIDIFLYFMSSGVFT
jgi:hypothetical protein